MSVVIRLRKTGTKKKIKHRIVVCDSRSPRDGKFIEILGIWDPNTTPATLVLDQEKTKSWIAKGAQPSETMRSIIKKAGFTKAEATPSETKKAPIKKTATKKAAAK